MKYRFNVDAWGARFEVPAAVVSEYMRTSEASHLKVLLCILADARCTDTQRLSNLSGATLGEVDAAVKYWCGLGVISADDVMSDTAVNAAERFSDKNQPVSVVEAVKPSRTITDKRIVVNYTQREIQEKAERDANLKQLVNDIQGILKITINGKELGRLVELYELYHFDVATILLAAEYCSGIGKSSIAYLYTVMVRWFEDDITDYTQVEQAVIKGNELRSFENRVLRIFGMENKPSKKQREYIEKWNNMGFSLEMLEIAYDKCLDEKKSLRFDYINGILKKWNENGVATPKQVQKADESFKSKRSSFKQPQEKKTSYDLEEFENFALNINLNDYMQGGKDGGE